MDLLGYCCQEFLKAKRCSMCISFVRIKVQQAKSGELLAAVQSLMKRFRRANGCLGYRLSRDVEDEYALYLIGEWESHQSLESHLGSPDFEVLHGAIRVLATEFRFHSLCADKLR